MQFIQGQSRQQTYFTTLEDHVPHWRRYAALAMCVGVSVPISKGLVEIISLEPLIV